MTGTRRTLLVVSCHHFFTAIFYRASSTIVYIAQNHSLDNEQAEGHSFPSHFSMFLFVRVLITSISSVH